ncbi:MAG: right-handed parallel beta-helix repeat-containing protein [Candidatus Hodarchaeota archaeon]
MPRNCSWTSIILILLIFFPCITSNYFQSTVLKSINSTQNDSENQLLIHNISKPGKSSFFQQQQFINTVSWINDHVTINQSQSFDAATKLLIINSSVKFSPLNDNSDVRLIIGSDSQLEICNSSLYLNTSTNRKGSIVFNGGTLVVLNSTFVGLGIDSINPGLTIKESQVVIFNSTFELGSAGVGFEDSSIVEIINCTFQNISTYGICGSYSSRISIYESKFKNIYDTGLFLETCNNINIIGSQFKQCTIMCLQIEGSKHEYYCQHDYPCYDYYDAYDIYLEGNLFQDSGLGTQVIGNNVSIIDNSFLNLSVSGSFIGGRNILIQENLYQKLLRGITTPSHKLISHVHSESEEWFLSSISNATIKRNYFEDVKQYGVWVDNYDYVTLFHIIQNTFTNIGSSSGGAALAFTGNIGGVSSTNRSWVIGNVINNSAGYGVLGSFCVGFELPSHLAHFKYISFVRNAFINCSLGYTWFEPEFYYLEDIRWDDSLFGNYWDDHCNTNPKDEDYNQIGDSFFNISTEYAQVDKAPLLSLDLVDQEIDIGSTHPLDLELSKAELKVNETINWTILADNEVTISVWLDNKQCPFERNNANISVSLKTLKVGLHNFTLIIQTDSRIYRDLVWIRVLGTERNLITELLLPLGVSGLIIGVIIFILLRSKKGRIFQNSD